ncbi:hypothetical protein C7412_109227 [Paraburkholderia silvatlantica]|nr:hypothetical protein C7412_109227 [Paraburkholderia silvatlantica]
MTNRKILFPLGRTVATLSPYYVGPDREKLWVITIWDRSATTILCRNES